jgi:signal peptidase II
MWPLPTKSRWFWPLAAFLVLSDCTTKALAVERLEPAHVPHEVLGESVRFTLTYNPGAAFSMSAGENSRWILTFLAVAVLAILWRAYQAADRADRWQGAALGLVAGGALGNLLDRLRGPLGVVDFIDVGVGDWRFWTFNLADVGVTVGAVMLALVLVRARDAAAVATE